MLANGCPMGTSPIGLETELLKHQEDTFATIKANACNIKEHIVECMEHQGATSEKKLLQHHKIATVTVVTKT